MKGPLDMFFALGDKVTKGDPRRQQDFTYYMLWILFIAFFWLFIHNAYQLVVYKNLNSATWTLVGFAIMGLQFFSLKSMHDIRQLRNKPRPPVSVESVTDMMNSFNEEKEVKKENGIRKENKETRTSI